ncbi:MAG: ORF6C domain-containing protein [Candidatus Promineofilum sp.]|nr:ORF6C domain-containing protein [Promineifilum sp.]
MSALIPVEQKSVLFYDDTIIAIAVDTSDAGRQVYVPIRPIAESLGLAWRAQRLRLHRDPVLSRHVKGGIVTIPPSPGARGGGPQEMLCLPLEYINGWLFTISADRVRPELRDRIIRYQEHCYRVLAEAFQEGRLTVEDTDILAGVSPETAQAVHLAQAILALARNQALMEQRASTRFQQLETRLETIEDSLNHPGRTVSQDQASQISQAVKAVALALGKASGRNEFGGVYGEFYRKFGITSYKLLPARRFEEAMRFLTDWHGEVTGQGELPF